MGAESILILIVAIMVFDFLFEKTLSFLNLKNLKTELPKELKGIYDEEKYKKSIQYTRENSRFSFITSSFSFILSLILILTGFFGWLDAEVRTFIDTEIFVSLAFFGILFLASDIINIPFQLYDTFVIEEKYGFNTTTPKLFVADKLKGYLLTILIGGVIMYILLVLVKSFGQSFWIYFWAVIAFFMLFMNMFYTTLILPLFNKLTPLENDELKEEI